MNNTGVFLKIIGMYLLIIINIKFIKLVYFVQAYFEFTNELISNFLLYLKSNINPLLKSNFKFSLFFFSFR